MQKLFSLIIISLITLNAHGHNSGSEKNNEPIQTQFDKTDCKNQVHLKVNGMVCEFCVQTIGKVFEKDKAITDTYFNLDTSTVGIAYADGNELSDTEIKNYIEDAGFDLVQIDRGCLTDS